MTTLQQSLLFVVIIFSVAVLGALVFQLSPVLAPFLVAATLAYLTDPLVERLSSGKWKMHRALSVTLVFTLVVILFLVTLFFLVPALSNQLFTLAQKIPVMIDWAQKVLMPQLMELGWVKDDFGFEAIKSAAMEHISAASQIAHWLWQTIFHSGVVLIGWLMNVAIVFVVTFYLLRDWRKILASCESILPKKIAPRVVRIAEQCDVVLSAFIRGQLAVMAALGTIYGLGLAIIGVHFSLLLGVLAGILSIVPYLGSAVGLGTALLVAYFQFHALWPIIGVLVLFGIGNILEGMVLAPLLIGDKLGLHPVAVIFAILAGGHLFGFVGVLLALPIAAIIVVLMRDFMGRSAHG